MLQEATPVAIYSEIRMTDKDLLERVSIAYQEYSKITGKDIHIEEFISWMYKIYGIIEKKDNK